MTVVSVRDLRVELTSGADVVDDVSFDLSAGEVVGLVGESGSGKTTLGVSLLGDVRSGARFAGGTIVVDGADVRTMNARDLRAIRGSGVAYVPQDPGTALNPAMRIGKQLDELFEFHPTGLRREEVKARIAETLAEVGLDDADLLHRFPHQLSGGQQQRVTIAMAFALRPKVIVLDEPTTGLDVSTQAQVLSTVRDLSASHDVAALYVTHDLTVVANLARRLIVMYAGRLVEVGDTAAIFASPSHPYTRQLLAALPTATARENLIPIVGRPPAPGARPTGCAFHPRCDLATEKCSSEVPPLVMLDDATREVRCHHASVAVESRPRTGRDGRASTLDATLTEAKPLLRVAGLSAFHGSKQILHDVSLDLRAGECLAVVGESGSGKTTLSRCLIGLHHDFGGTLEFDGAPLRRESTRRSVDQRRAIQYIFQNPYSALNPRLTVGESIRTPLELLMDVGRRDSGKVAREALERVSLSPDTADKYPAQLSGGERQRVAIARALVCKPRVLICDEITSALDVSVQASIVRLLHRLQDEDGLGLLFVTHNLALVPSIADSVAAVHHGRVVEHGPSERVFARPEADYTQRLLAHTPALPSQEA